MRRFVLLLTTLACLAVPAALAKGSFPETIPLPNGFQPEGIAVGRGDTFYVGSIPTGAVYAGSLRTGTGNVLVPGAPGHAATGLEYNHERLWVSGAGTGKAFVYSAHTGALLNELQLATSAGPTFINDVVVTGRAAYFTDSNRPLIYKVSKSSTGSPGAVTPITLTGDYQQVAGFNLNGIDATPSGRTLLTVQSATGKLFTIDPKTGATKLIDLGGATLPNGDGILLHGRTLYVVQNQLNKIAVVKLNHSLTRGVVTGTITDSDFDVPTTIAKFGKWLYAVNARFGTPSPATATYNLVRVDVK
jgi:sugar lactone lactonase YvrE